MAENNAPTLEERTEDATVLELQDLREIDAPEVEAHLGGPGSGACISFQSVAL